MEVLKKHKMPEEVIVMFEEACYLAAQQENFIEELKQMLDNAQDAYAELIKRVSFRRIRFKSLSKKPPHLTKVRGGSPMYRKNTDNICIGD
ncbi:hypothetical protein [Halobacillus yeomjeoni]|uniref:Uncharacterized protein n=1 Tax=Halobacillus yeomjeoni TaxID=311194 RepID=A0A931HV67_9BACI|nr:hypothetical protein [Halobacillus yeomjeoni]MBH0230059.1 hypothetical protein [Halobacillus yeomjeoni]